TARTENIRRVAEVAKLMSDAGAVVIVALVSPSTADRAMARAIIGDGFREVYIAASAEACRERDPKGHYKEAASGRISTFTGVSAQYEAPNAPNLVIESGKESIEASIEALNTYARGEFGRVAILGKVAKPA